MRKTLSEIAKIIEGEVVGDADLVITGFNGIHEAKEGDLTFVANPKYYPLAEKTKASAIIAPRDLKIPGKALIRTKDPSLAFAKIMSLADQEQSQHIKGIHATAIIGSKVKLGRDVAVGAYAVIEDEATIGDGTIIYAGCFVGHHTVIGSQCLLYPHVTIRERIQIGNNVILHSGAVIGADGFGFATVDGRHVKIPQMGTVVIGDDVEIGANSAVDRARFGKTVIGKGTKIDNLVHIAHNVEIGENCIIVAQVGISGSTIVGKNVIMAGQAGIAGHLKIGDGAIVTAQAGVGKDIPPNTQVIGFPAHEHMLFKRVNACLWKLPEYVKELRDLKKKIEEREK